MPRNTTQLGSTGWERFVFEGVTPDSTIWIDPDDHAKGKFSSESRIEVAVSGATDFESSRPLLQIKQGEGDTLRVNHITFENNLNNSDFMITQFRISDISENIPDIDNQQEDRSLVNGGVVWTRTYNDNSKDLVVYNPLRNIHTVEGITSNAKVWLLHADVSGNWTTGNLYGIVEPSFTGYSPTPTVNTFEGSGSGVQYEIIF